MILVLVVWLGLGVPTSILYGIGYLLSKIQLVKRINLITIWVSVWILAIGVLVFSFIIKAGTIGIISVILSGLPAGIVSARLEEGKALPLLPIFGAYIMLGLLVASSVPF